MEETKKPLLPDVAKIPQTIRKYCNEQLDKMTGSMLGAFQAPLIGMTYALEAKDSYSYDHSERVAQLCKKFAVFLDTTPVDRYILLLTAQVHDIGKIGIPDSVLLKPGKLTDEEYDIMKRHSTIGADIIRKSSQFYQDDQKTPFAVPDLFRVCLQEMEKGIRHHHERWNGRGYPDGLAGEDIPKFARIIALCDSTDAMLSTRIYRKALSVDQCREEIAKNSGIMYDPDLTQIYLARWDEIVTPVYADR